MPRAGYKRRPWNLLPLRHVTKSDICVSDQQRCLANQLVEEWTNKNSGASLEEEMNFAASLILYLKFLSCCNVNMLMDGTRRDDARYEIDATEFDRLKREELKMLDKIHKQLDSALAKSGRTGVQKKISEDIRTSAEAAAVVYEKFRGIDGNHIEENER